MTRRQSLEWARSTLDEPESDLVALLWLDETHFAPVHYCDPLTTTCEAWRTPAGQFPYLRK